MIIQKLGQHDPSKNKKLRNNYTPFVKKELNKALINRSRLKNGSGIYNFRKILMPFKMMKNVCRNLTKNYRKANKQRVL